MYENILRIAEKMAREIRYDTTRGGGGSGGEESKSFSNYWILNTTFWRDVGLWIDTETWND